MANTAKFNARVIQKHDIEANWLKATGFIPLEGEVIIYDAEVAGDELPAGREERITHARMKIGDGVTLVSNLEFVNKYAEQADVATLAGYAGMAEQDGEGHNIVATYATKSEISGVENTVTDIIEGDIAIGLANRASIADTLGASTIGGLNQPIYLNSGTPRLSSKYAGGTQVTVNTVNMGATEVSFYAPTTGGTSGYILQSNGSGNAPTWINAATARTNLEVYSKTEVDTAIASHEDVHFAHCTAASSDSSKEINCEAFTPIGGNRIIVMFQYENTSMNPEFLLNGDGVNTYPILGMAIVDGAVSPYIPRLRALTYYDFVFDSSSNAFYIMNDPDYFDLISVDDIDTICGAMIQVASANDRSVTF